MTRPEIVTSHVLQRLTIAQPFWQCFDAFRDGAFPFLLDSATDPEKLGRFSFMGCEPFAIFRAKRLPHEEGEPSLARCSFLERPELRGSAEGDSKRIQLRGSAEGDSKRIQLRGSAEGEWTATDYVANPFEEVRRKMSELAISPSDLEGRPVPFLGGAVGYLGFEAGHFIEDLPDRGDDDLGLPDIHLCFYDRVLAFCHRTSTAYLSVIGRAPSRERSLALARRGRDEWLERLGTLARAHPAPTSAASPTGAESAMPQPQPQAQAKPTRCVSGPDYGRLVERVKEHILSGDVFELCLTHRIEAPFEGDTWALYSALRSVNPAPFAGWLALPEATIVSSSPERFLSLSAERIAESRPIKGTRPRGATDAEDDALREALRESPKDQAENNMIVDLVRNDLGRVCRFGTVHVPELRIVESYATVHQMVSTIRGELEDGVSAVDLVQACFPGGSMTGAPKIEALKLIDALEPVKRGVYSGSIGYLDFAGPIDLNIVIRTIVVKDGRAYLNVGGAIVADSDPAAEYQETLDKARALLRALASSGA